MLELSFSLGPLKALTLDHLAHSVSASDPRLQPPNYPKRLRGEIEEHRANIGSNYACSAETGCSDCRSATDQTS